MNPLEQHIEFWRSYTPVAPPYLHPEDRAALMSRSEKRFHSTPFNFDSYVETEWNNEKETNFHSGLLPSPYLGDLCQAKVIVLMTNPGFHIGDYWAQQDHTYVGAAKSNLHQELGGREFPFIFLDPKFCWHAGFEWWERKLRSITMHVWKRQGLTNYKTALRTVSKHVAAMELMPYHSRSASYLRIPSVESAQRAAAYLGSIESPPLKTLIVARSAKLWAVPRNSHVVVLGSGQARTASLNVGTVAGDAILEALLT